MKQIIAVCFIYEPMGGIWLEFADGSRHWHSTDYLERKLGFTEMIRLCRIALHDGMTGLWYKI